jgi:hypothetical protein
MWRSSSIEESATVAVLVIDASMPPIRMRFPAGASWVGITYLWVLSEIKPLFELVGDLEP